MSELQLGRLHPTAQSLCRAAIDCGWSARQIHDTAVLIHSPFGNQDIMLTTQMNEAKRKTFLRKIAKYGDPVKVVAMTAMAEGLVTPSGTLTEPIEKTTVDVPDPVIVSEQPWMAKQGSTAEVGRHYESATTIERRWSDGAIDYRCTWPGCDYTNALPRSVSTHYARRLDHTVIAQQGPVILGPAYEWTARLQARSDRLAREIRNALGQVADYDKSDEEAFAQHLAEAIIKERDKRGEAHADPGELGASEPLTAEQVLERIRRMVDDGSYMARVSEADDLREKLERSERNAEVVIQTANEVADELASTKERLASAEAEWEALSEIVHSRKGATG